MRTGLRALDRFFGRFSRPWLAATAAAGAVWLVASFPVSALVAVHPILGLLGAILHVIGLAALIGSGVIFAVLFWRDYLNERFFGR